MATDPADAAGRGGDSGAGTGASGVAGSSGGGDVGVAGSGGRTTHPAPTRPDQASQDGAAADQGAPADTSWFDPSVVGGLLGVGAGPDPASAAPAAGAGAAATGSAPTGADSALPSPADHSSNGSAVALLAVSLLVLLGLLGGVAVRWWDRRPGRYWPA